MSKRPELTAAERALPYAKFYDLPITPIPEEKLAVLAAGPIDPSLALKIEDRNDLFKPGYLPCEIGYCVMPNGTGFLANRTEMPGVTPEMFEWWFAWHSLEDLRYRIWDPEDHYYARQQMREKTLDQSLPMRERSSMPPEISRTKWVMMAATPWPGTGPWPLAQMRAAQASVPTFSSS